MRTVGLGSTVGGGGFSTGDEKFNPKSHPPR